jgi:hypothetical protein
MSVKTNPEIPRHRSETELEEIVFDSKSLKQLRNKIDELIALHGEDAYVKETCKPPHDNYSFSVFRMTLESDEAYLARCEAERQKKIKALEAGVERIQANISRLRAGR